MSRMSLDKFLGRGYIILEILCFTIWAESGHSPSLKSYGELK